MPAVAPAQGCRLGITLPSPPLTPAVLAYPATSRKPYNAILLDRCNKTARVVSKYNLRPLPILSCSRSSLGSHQEPNSFFSRGPGSLISAASSAFSGGNQGGMFNKSPILPGKRRFSIQARAQKSNSGSLRYPALTEKPEWWWRTLACVPYLISLQISDTGFYIQPLLEHYECFEDLIYYIPGAVKRLPMWFPMLYCYLSYIHVVKKKEWPIFLRYNVMMAMLLETGLQIVWHSSNFMPLVHFNGPFGMYYWAAVGFIYIFILLECIRCALGGRFVRIPFVTEAALIHSLYHVGGFQRPF